MGDVILGHGEDGKLGNRTLLTANTPGTFIQARKVGIQVAGITAASGDLLAGGGHFTQGFGVVGQVS